MMSKEEMISTTVIIGGRSYPLKIEESKVSMVRSAAKEISEQLQFFQSTYKDRDLQDCLSMTLLAIAMKLEENNSAGSALNFREQLGKIDEILQTALDQ